MCKAHSGIYGYLTSQLFILGRLYTIVPRYILMLNLYALVAIIHFAAYGTYIYNCTSTL